MNKNELFRFIDQEFDVQPDYPWAKYPDAAVFRHTNNQKWFGLYMRVAETKLGFEGNKQLEIINVKARPEMIGVLRQSKGIYPAYHMNKEHWVTLVLQSELTQEDIVNLITDSFDLTNT